MKQMHSVNKQQKTFYSKSNALYYIEKRDIKRLRGGANTHQVQTGKREHERTIKMYSF